MNIKKFHSFKLIFIALALLFLAFGYGFGLFDFFNLQYLRQNAEQLLLWKNNHFLSTSLIFILLYIASIALSLPISTLLTLSAGFLFGRFLGTFYAVMASTIGALLLYFTIRWVMMDFARSKVDSLIHKIEKGLQQNGFWYILSLRLMPALPFWLLNLTCAFLRVPTRPYAMATFLGIIPVSFIYASLGTSLKFIHSTKDLNFMRIIEMPTLWIPLLLLAFLSSLPLMIKKINQRRKTA